MPFFASVNSSLELLHLIESRMQPKRWAWAALYLLIGAIALSSFGGLTYAIAQSQRSPFDRYYQQLDR